MHRSKVHLASIVLILAALACGPLSAIGSGPSEENSEETTQLTPSPNTIHLTVGSATGDAASAVLGPDGGQLETQASDGTAYRLNLPPGALLSPVEISMTPVQGTSDNLPGQPLGMVRLSPDGLRLTTPATLTITPAIIADEMAVAGFSARSSGQDFALQMTGSNESSFLVSVTHFSTLGAWQVPVSQLGLAMDLISKQVPMDAIDRHAHRIGREQLGKPGDEDAARAFFKEWIDWWEAQIKGELEAAVDDPGLLDQAIYSYLTWEGTVRRAAEVLEVDVYSMAMQVNGSGQDMEFQTLRAAVEDINSVARPLMAEGLNNGIVYAHQQCVNQQDPDWISIILRWANVGRRLALGPDGFDQAKADDLARRCATFDVTFQSTATLDEETFSVHAQTRTDFLYMAKVEAELIHDPLNFEPSGNCQWTAVNGMVGLRGAIDVNFWDLDVLGDKNRIAADLYVSITDPPRMGCEGEGLQFAISPWWLVYQLNHTGKSDRYSLYPGDIPEVFGQTTFQGFNTAGGEETDITIIHNPVP